MQNLVEDTVLYGIVSGVQELNLRINIGDNIQAFIATSNISQYFVKSLNGEVGIPAVLSLSCYIYLYITTFGSCIILQDPLILPKLFSVGMPIVCKLLRKGDGRGSLECTLEPKSVNSYVHASGLVPGTVCFTADR